MSYVRSPLRSFVFAASWLLAVAGCTGGEMPATAADAEPAPAAATAAAVDEPPSAADPAAPPDAAETAEAPAAAETAEAPAAAASEVPAPARPGEISEEDLRRWREWERVGPPFEPPDGEWLVDDLGRRYFTHPVPRLPGAHVLIDDGKRVRLPQGLVMDVESYDEEWLYVKVYGAPPEVTARRRSAEEVEAERQARLAAEYELDAGEVDRLRFERFDQGLPKRGQWRNGFAVADVDRDGHLDLVHGPARKSMDGPVVFRGDGAGVWRPWRSVRFPADLHLDYGDAAVADFNRDGRPDLAFGSHLRGVVVLVAGEGDRFVRWSEGIDYSVAEAGEGPSELSSRSIEPVDWNRDGWIDLLALGEGPRLAMGAGSSEYGRGSTGVFLYLNNGDGTWELAEAGSGGERLFGDALAVADVDGDGLQDFFVGASTRGRKDLLFLGQPDGGWRQTEVPAIREDAMVRAVEVDDLDGDGRADLALGWISYWLEEWRTGVDVLLAREDGWERRALGVEESQNGVWSIDTGDLDADGARDLVAITGVGEVWVFLGDGRGGFERQPASGVEAPGFQCTGYDVALVDVDGEPGDELIAGFAGEAGSEVLLVSILGSGRPYCPSGGGLAAWKPSVVSATAESPAAAGGAGSAGSY